MKYKVTNKQYTSKHCFVCGEENKSGLKARFYELENGEVAAIFTAAAEHCGYPGRLHGGVASAIVDETIGRAIAIIEPNTFSVTLELTVQFKKPVPLGKELKVIGRVISDNGRVYEGTAELLLENGEPAVTGWAKYLKMPIEKIAKTDNIDDELLRTAHPNDLIEIDI